MVDRKPMNDQSQRFTDMVNLLADPLLDSEGMKLIDVECHREPRGWVLKVFIDKPGGVTIDDCAWVSRHLGDVLDAKTAFDEPYRLEVSSPGLDRPLRKPEHFVYFQGRPVVIKTSREVEGKKHLRGILAGFSEDVVKLERGSQLVTVPYETIVEAHLDAKSSWRKK